MSVLGGPAAVLIGDFWLVKAMERILEASVHGDIVIRLFARTLSDLAEGEILQLQKAEKGDTEESDYLRIIYNKTASLFVAASVSAAISVGANKRMKEAVKEYAADLGIAFQIKDDIFDYSENAAIGKPVGIDLKERKITLPLIGALSNVDTDKAVEIRRKVSHIEDDPLYVSEIRRFVTDNGGMEYAGRKLEEYVCKGIIALKALPESDERRYLKSLAEFVADRKS
jgi:octaprenyl-diphosphate synthase